MAIEIVSCPIKNGDVLVYQRVNLHFPMVFLWFSHYIKPPFSYGKPHLPGKLQKIGFIQPRWGWFTIGFASWDMGIGFLIRWNQSSWLF